MTFPRTRVAPTAQMRVLGGALVPLMVEEWSEVDVTIKVPAFGYVIARSSPRVCAALFQPPSSIPHWLDTTYVDGVLTALLLGKTDRLDVIVEGLKP